MNDPELKEEKEMLLASKDPTFLDFYNRRNVKTPKNSSNFFLIFEVFLIKVIQYRHLNREIVP